MSYLGYYGGLQGVHDAFVSGDYAFLACGMAGFSVVNISDPSDPILVGECDTQDEALAVVVSGQYAYVADKEGGLRIIDVSHPQNPVEAGFSDTPGWAMDVALQENLVYVADWSEGYTVVDVSEPENPVVVDNYDTGWSASSIVLAGTCAYTANGELGLKILDISDPLNIYGLGYFYRYGPEAENGCVSGDYAYLADGGLRILDISDPASPREISRICCSGPGGMENVEVSGNYAYLARFTRFSVVDVSDPSDPIEVWQDYIYSEEDMVIEGDYLYLSWAECDFPRLHGFTILDISESTSPTVAGTLQYVGGEGVDIADNYAYLSDGGWLIIIDISQP